MIADQVVFAAAAAFLIVGLSTLWWGMRPSSIGQRHTILVFAWLCASLSATLVVFSLFPNSRADGSLLGVTLGGAGAFAILVWTAALRASNRAERRDQLEARLQDRDREIMALRQELTDVARQRRPRPLGYTETYLYRVAGIHTRSPRHLGIVTGDLRTVRCAEVWVNSENTDMQMARTQEHSISGLIRYESALHDDAGRVLEEPVADELNRKTNGRRPVPAGTVVVTNPGELAHCGVRHIAHVATVHGEPGGGFRQVRELGRCVTNVLTAVGTPAIDPPTKTVLFPLLGAGQGGGDPLTTAGALANAVVGYFMMTPTTSIETVYILAYTDSELTDCVAALRATSRLVREPRPVAHSVDNPRTAGHGPHEEGLRHN
jgi:O-acetyl-ADP-ribose deacetylase (regulator of RNase III)